MAELGFHTINEMIGQVDNLEVRDDIRHWKHNSLDLQPILYKKEEASEFTGLYKMEEQDHGIEGVLDFELLEKAKPALENLQPVTATFEVKNTDRTIGAFLSNEISKI